MECYSWLPSLNNEGNQNIIYFTYFNWFFSFRIAYTCIMPFDDICASLHVYSSGSACPLPSTVFMPFPLFLFFFFLTNSLSPIRYTTSDSCYEFLWLWQWSKLFPLTGKLIPSRKPTSLAASSQSFVSHWLRNWVLMKIEKQLKGQICRLGLFTSFSYTISQEFHGKHIF